MARMHAGASRDERHSDAGPEDDFYVMSDPYEKGTEAAIKRVRGERMRAALGSVIVLAVVACVVALGPASGLLSNMGSLAYTGSDGLEKNIMITGLADEPFTLTESELAELPTASETVEGYEQLPPEQAAIYELGPTLATLAEAYGHELSEYAEVCFVSNTTYSVGATAETLAKDLVLTLRTPDGPLPDKYLPMQVILPERNNQNWAFGVISIDFSTEIKEPEPEIL